MQTQHVKQSKVRLLSFSGMKCSLRRSLFSGHHLLLLLLPPSPWLCCPLSAAGRAAPWLELGELACLLAYHSTEQERGASHRLETESQKLQEQSKGISGTPALSSVYIERHMRLQILKCLIFLMKKKN